MSNSQIRAFEKLKITISEMSQKSMNEQPADRSRLPKSRRVIRGMMLGEVVSRKFRLLRFIANFPHCQILKFLNSQIENLTFTFLQEIQDYKICTVDTFMRRQYVSGIVFHYPDPGAPCFNMFRNRVPVFRTHQGICQILKLSRQILK